MNTKRITTHLLALMAVMTLAYLTSLLTVQPLYAANLPCPAESQINIDFKNGAGWQMCWESKKRENIVLSDIHYRNAQAQETRVISTLRLAQLHVAYDDSNVTYYDVTQFGLGAGFVSTLSNTDCPGGELINLSGRPGFCVMKSSGESAFLSSSETRLSESVSLFSVSQVGSYAYLVTWKFLDDGSIAPSVGAAGALQRSSDWAESPFGRALEGVPDKSWLSHTHNYYWRIDFDIGEDANNDVVTEISYPLDTEGRRARRVNTLETEAARKIDPDNMLAWHITDSATDIERSPGYVIEPIHYGHKLVRTITEPFTDYDFFVTKQSDCERFISENAKFNPDCDENILQFVNDESLVNEDIVAWHRISFHHVPRNEDRVNMHSHWDGFVMQARNLSANTPGHSGRIENYPPQVTPLEDQVNTVQESVEFALQSNDPDGDTLSYVGQGLPDGIILNAAGFFSGQPTKDGNYLVSVNVSDDEHTSSISFNWRINQSTSKSGGSGAAWPLLCLVLGMLLRRGGTFRDFFQVHFNIPIPEGTAAMHL